MKSLDKIKSDLKLIAANNNLYGTAIDLQIELLASVLYDSQSEIISAAKEVGLNSARLINSKIERCLDVMYSVYRGRNPKLIIPVPRIIPTSIVYNPFDPLYISNNLYLYAANQININASVSDVTLQNTPGVNGLYIIVGILSDKLMNEINYNPNNLDLLTHYFNLSDNGNYLSNVSEDIYIKKNGSDINWSREFIDHVNADDSDEYIAAMTIQDYGVRLYRRELFSASDTWNIRSLPYSNTQYESDRLNRVKVPLTEELSTVNLDINYLINHEPNFVNYLQDQLGFNVSELTILDNALVVPGVPRDTASSLLYYANESERVGSYVRSNYDVTHLFHEYFIDQVDDADYILADQGQGVWMMSNFYIPRIGQSITNQEFINYTVARGGYLIGYNDTTQTSNILQTHLPGVNRELTINLVTYNNGSIDLTNEITEILNKWSRSLDKQIRLGELESEISKLTDIKYVEELKLINWIDKVDYRYNQNIINFPGSNSIVWRRVMQLDYVGGPNRTYTMNNSPLTESQVLSNNKCRYFTFNLNLTQRNYYEVIS